MSRSDVRPVEPGTRLLHIGPHKTGTSAVQSAFHSARPRLAAHGVHYAGRGRQPFYEAVYAAGSRPRPGDPQPDPASWDRLVEEVRSAGGQRVVISSEMFDDADEEHARSIVQALGGDAVHIVVTLRPLAALLPSAWQQYVRNKSVVPYEQWLTGMFLRKPYNRPTPTFWARHSHDELVERWVRVVGADRLTVVLGDERDPSVLISAFEQLLALPEGTLVPEPGRSNRSLTHAETELLRLINIDFRDRKLPDEIYAKTVRDRFLPALQDRVPEPGEVRTATPAWALERAAARGARAAERIGATGVRVIGDLSVLGSATGRTAGPEAADPAHIPVRAALEIVQAAWASPPPKARAMTLEDRPLRAVRATDLVRVLGRRARARARVATAGIRRR